ncbi:MAG: hypothetical protein R3E31_23065 [Chloroflexota bacterium]
MAQRPIPGTQHHHPPHLAADDSAGTRLHPSRKLAASWDGHPRWPDALPCPALACHHRQPCDLGATHNNKWLVVGHAGRIYHANAFALPAQEVWTRAVVWGKLLIMQLTPVNGFLLILAGFHPALTRTSRRPNVLLAATAVLYILYAFTYATLDSTVLLLPALLLGAVLLMPALHRLRAWALLLPLALLLINFNQQDLHQGDDLRVRTETTLQQAPDHAIVLTPGNETIFTLWYFHHVEKQRPDVILVDENLFAFTWYRQQLAQTYPGLQQLAVDDWTGFIAANQASRPIIFIDLHNDGNN